MEWQQLLGFYQVARLGSFTQAAAATFRTQSAVSQQVRALEAELDCLLLERIGKRRLRLTAAGERLLAFVQILLDRYEGLKEDLDVLKGRQTGRLSLAAPFTTLYHLVPPVAKAYARQFPEVELTLLDRSQAEVIALVRSGEVDLGLALESLAPRDLAIRRWQPVNTVLLAPLGHPLTRVKRLTLAKIARHPLIFPPPNHRGRRLLEARFQKLGLPYRVVMESSNVELSSVYVELGVGISFASVVRDLPGGLRRNLAVLPLDRHFPPDHLALVLRPDKVLAPYKKAFVNLLFGDIIFP
jgi:DNA-binding transcriptional LysR family regulator